MKRDLSLFIDNILEKIDLIEGSTGEISKDKLESDGLLVDATVRRLEIIGEAVKNISKDLKEKHLEVLWKKIPAYFDIDFGEIWNIIKEDIPDLKEKILKIKEEL